MYEPISSVLGISLQHSFSKHSVVTSQDMGEKVSYSFWEARREFKFEWFEQPTQFTCVHKNTQRPILAHKHTRFLSSSHTHTQLGKHRSRLAYKPDQRASSLWQTKYICYNSFTSSSVPCLHSFFLTLSFSFYPSLPGFQLQATVSV